MAPRHVLVIDDQPSIVHFLRCSLEERWLGCSVDVAQTTGQARALLRQNRYDFVLTDYQLHDGDGLELAAMVKERLGPVPVVLMTATPPAAVQAPSGLARNGITAMLRKPFDLAQLFDIIETAAPGDRQDVAYA